MMGEDLIYLERRAEEELELAQRSSCPGAVKAHYELAGLYRTGCTTQGTVKLSRFDTEEGTYDIWRHRETSLRTCRIR